ncbi:interleukin-8-like [Cheilinus undulatus]|uniref:interleukin-8-like n=1 Tax=Cheilinus undulatus TaxID=241271 RepID=UPI001BD52E9F|nr:interleukin-8-like [Cheilinus undulatus]
MSTEMSGISIVALLVFLAVPEGISLGNQGFDRCQCITKEKRPIGRHIRTVQVIQPSSHCQDMEIVATLKKDGKRVCLDPNVPWVKKTLERQQTQQTP